MSLLVGQTEHQYITVIRAPYPGYAVVIPHPERPGQHVRKKFFGTRKSLDEHLQDAIKWRDEAYFALHKQVIPARLFHHQQNNSKTATPGVRRVEKVVKKQLKDGSVARYRVACIVAEIWTKPGRDYQRPSGSKSKIYSISKYGEQEAMRLARDWRKQMERILAANSEPSRALGNA